MQQLAGATSFIVNCLGQLSRHELISNLFNDPEHFTSKIFSELDTHAALRAAVPHESTWNQASLQDKGLGHITAGRPNCHAERPTCIRQATFRHRRPRLHLRVRTIPVPPTRAVCCEVPCAPVPGDVSRYRHGDGPALPLLYIRCRSRCRHSESARIAWDNRRNARWRKSERQVRYSQPLDTVGSIGIQRVLVLEFHTPPASMDTK